MQRSGPLQISRAQRKSDGVAETSSHRAETAADRPGRDSTRWVHPSAWLAALARNDGRAPPDRGAPAPPCAVSGTNYP
jgi:hypothetical protein